MRPAAEALAAAPAGSWRAALGAALAGALAGTGLLMAQSLPFKWSLAILGLLLALAALPLVLRLVSYRHLLLAAIVACLPFKLGVQFFYRLHQGGAPSVSLGLIDFLLLLAAFSWLAGRALGAWPAFRWRSPLDWPLLAILATSLLSLAPAADRQLAFFELVWLARSFLTFYILYNLLRDASDLRTAYLAIVFSLLLQSVLALGQFVQLLPSSSQLAFLGLAETDLTQELGSDTFLRPGGSLGHPNNLGRYLLRYLPLILAGVWVFKGLASRGLAWAATLLGFCALVATMSRSSWLGMALAAALLPWMLWRDMTPRLRRGLLLGMTGLLLATLLVFHGFIAQRFLEDDQGSLYSRLGPVKVALAIIADHPLLGVGLNNFGQVMFEPRYASHAEGFAPWEIIPVHNPFLLAAAETGLIGLAALVWFIIALLRLGRGEGKGQGAGFNLLRKATVAGLAGSVLAAMLNNIHWSGEGHFWCAIALACALWRPRAAPAGG